MSRGTLYILLLATVFIIQFHINNGTGVDVKLPRKSISSILQQNAAKREKEDELSEEDKKKKDKFYFKAAKFLFKEGMKVYHKNITNGTRHIYEGCIMDVMYNGSLYNIDLEDETCQNIMSIPRIYEKFMEKKMSNTAAKIFAPLEKFNVMQAIVDNDNSEVYISAKAKEPFSLLPGGRIKVREATAMVTVNTTCNSFEKLGIEIQGKFSIGSAEVSMSLVKPKNCSKGRFMLHVKSICVGALFKAFSRKKNLDEDTKTSAITGATLSSPIISGVRDADGNSELVISAMAQNFPGLGEASFFVMVKVADGNPAQVAVVVRMMEVKPALIIAKLVGADLKKIPIVNDIQLDLIIEFATDQMGLPEDEELNKVLKAFSQYSVIDKGTKIKLMVPFKELIEKRGAEVPADTNLDQWLTIVINCSKISFEFDENAPMDLLNILIALLPKFASGVFEKIFKRMPRVKFNKFLVDIRTKAVDIELETTDLIPLGTNFVTLVGAKFSLTHNCTGPWDFSFKSELKIGDGRMCTSIRKTGDIYKLSGKIDSITTADLVGQFKVDSRAAAIFKKISGLNFGLKNIELSVDIGDKLNIKIAATAIFSSWAAKFEGYVMDTTEGNRAMAFGLVVTNVGLNSVMNSMFNKNGNKIGILDADWLSQITIAVTFANCQALKRAKFSTPELAEALERASGSGKPMGGVHFYAKVIIPKECQKEAICEFVKKKIGSGQSLIIAGGVSTTGFHLTAGFEGSIKLTERFSLTSVFLGIRVDWSDGTAAVELTGQMVVPIKEKEVKFKAKLAFTLAGTICLKLTICGMWENAFGLSSVHFGDFEMVVGLNFISLQPSFAIAGRLHLGTNPNNMIMAELAGGYETIGLSPVWHVYCKFNKISIQAILEAFDTDISLPKAIKNSGFPNGLVAGASFPKGKHIDSLNVDLKAGFFLNGELNILGWTVMCNLEVNLPSYFRLDAKFSKLEIAGGAILLSSTDQKTGPSLEISLGIKTLKIEIDAYVEVLKIGAGAKISISNKGMLFDISGRFLDLFEAKLILKAPYGKLKDLPSTEWSVETCISEYVMDKVKDSATEEAQEAANATAAAQEETDKRVKSADSWYSKALDKVNYWKGKVLKLEDKLKEEIDELEEKKVKMDQTCVLKCQKKRVWVGGFGEKECVVGGRKILCPYWIEEKHMRDDPYCLSKCESSRFKFFKKIKGKFNKGKLKAMEKTLYFFSKMFSKVEQFFNVAKTLIEAAEKATQKLKAIGAAGAKLFSKLRKFASKYLFYLKKICLKSSMQVASKGLCFSIDADFFIGGKAGKRIILENLEGCLSGNFFKKLGRMIMDKAFPGVRERINDWGASLGFWKSSDDAGKEVEKKAKELEEEESKEEETIKDIELAHYRSEEIINQFPEVVVRNDDSMLAFRDLFDMDDDPKVAVHAVEPEDREDIALPDGLNFDTKSLSNSDESNKCQRAENIANVYTGVAQSIDFMISKNKKIKNSYEAFVKEYEGKFEKLGKRVLNETLAEHLNADDTENALYYINRAKDGIAKWKRRYESQYHLVDKSSLNRWRGLMSDLAVEKSLDIASFLEVLGTASKETAKRMKIPGLKGNYEKSLKKAEKIMQELFTGSDDDVLSAKEEAVKILSREAKTMMELTKQCKA